MPSTVPVLFLAGLARRDSVGGGLSIGRCSHLKTKTAVSRRSSGIGPFRYDRCRRFRLRRCSTSDPKEDVSE